MMAAGIGGDPDLHPVPVEMTLVITERNKLREKVELK